MSTLSKKDGHYEEAEREEMKINNTITDLDGIHLIAWEATIRNCKSLNTDLISFEPDGAVCAECAKYRNRVFSISEKDKRFPKLPDFILQNGCIHRNRVNYCCAQSFGDYHHGIRGLRTSADPIISSNCPYVDGRTKEEIERYEKFKSMYDIEQAQIQAREKVRPIYEMLQGHLPDVAPKSFGAFRRMKIQGQRII